MSALELEAAVNASVQLGATLVAMLFNLVPSHSTQACLYLAGAFAIVAGIVSCLRISEPAPLKRK